jgi:DNA polymerase-3 subunit beta
MKLTVLSTEFKRALTVARAAVNAKTTMPVLQNVLFRAENDTLTLAATDLSIGLTTEVSAKIEAAGATTLPARLLNDWVALIPNDVVAITLDERTQTTTLVCGGAKIDIKGIDADEFPEIPAAPATQFSLNAQVFKQALSATTVAAANHDSRPVLAGVYLHRTDRGLSLAAADGYRLAVRHIAVDVAESFQDFIAPASMLETLIPLLGDGDVEFALTATGGQAVFRTGQHTLIGRLVDGKFPDYERIIPREHMARLVCDTKELIAAIKLAGLPTRDTANAITLHIRNTPSLTSKSEERGASEATVNGTFTGKDVSVGLNQRFLLEAVSACGSAQVALETQSSQHPVVIRPVGDDGYTHVVMPMTAR